MAHGLWLMVLCRVSSAIDDEPSAISHQRWTALLTQTARLMKSPSGKGANCMTSTVNVADVERWASALGGAALSAYGIRHLKEKSMAGAMFAAAGTTLIYRGATGRWLAAGTNGINTATGRTDTRSALSGSRGVNVEEV